MGANLAGLWWVFAVSGLSAARQTMANGVELLANCSPFNLATLAGSGNRHYGHERTMVGLAFDTHKLGHTKTAGYQGRW